MTRTRSAYLEHKFPDLADWGYQVTSEVDCEYNCFAWALHDTSRNWGPPRDASDEHFWPAGAPAAATLDAFVQMFEQLGYVRCDTDDHEPAFEKIALFVDAAGEPTHAARQVGPEWWASKMGRHNDIEHPLRAIEGKEYGAVSCFLKKPRG